MESRRSPGSRALQTEASVRPIYDGAPGYQETLRFLDGHGFVMSGISQNNSSHFPPLVEFDCHLIRGDLVPKMPVTLAASSA